MARTHKIKVLSSNKVQWDKAVKHAKSLGAFSKDGQYDFRADKTALTIRPDGSILYSTLGLVPSGDKPKEVTVEQFLQASSLDAVGNATDCSGQVMAAINASAQVTQAIVQDIVEASPTSQDTLVVDSVTVLVQNSLLWRTIGIKTLERLGVDITMDDGKAYVIDMALNSAEELTAEYAAAQAEKELLDGEADAPYALFAKQMELISSITMKKVVTEVD